MNFKNMLSESAMKIAFGYHKDGSTVSVKMPRRRKKSNAIQRKVDSPFRRQDKS